MAFLCIGLSNQDYHASQSDSQRLDSRSAVLGKRRPGRRQPAARLVRRPQSRDLLGECRCAPCGTDGLEQVCGRRPQACAKAEAGIVIMDAGRDAEAAGPHAPSASAPAKHGARPATPPTAGSICSLSGIKGGGDEGESTPAPRQESSSAQSRRPRRRSLCWSACRPATRVSAPRPPRRSWHRRRMRADRAART